MFYTTIEKFNQNMYRLFIKPKESYQLVENGHSMTPLTDGLEWLIACGLL